MYWVTIEPGRAHPVGVGGISQPVSTMANVDERNYMKVYIEVCRDDEGVSTLFIDPPPRLDSLMSIAAPDYPQGEQGHLHAGGAGQGRHLEIGQGNAQ